MQHAPLVHQAKPKITRFRRAVVGLGGAGLLAIMAYAFSWTEAPAAKKQAEAPVTAQAAKPAPFLAELKEDYTPPEPKREEPAEPTAATREPQGEPKREPTKETKKETTPPTTKTPPKKDKPERWLFADVKEAKPLFQRPKGDPGASEAVQRASAIKPAPWVKPDDPRRVLFPDQVIPAITEQSINSDEPGTLRFLVTQNVMDTQGGNHVLIPQFTRGVSVMDGALREHQERVPFRVKSLRFPDGTFLPFDAQLGDRSGANAVPGTVNRHLGEKALAILGSAILSVGARIPFGSTDNYHPNLAQEFAEDFSGGINRAGQQIVNKALTRKNTITQQAGYPVTIQFLEPVSFQQPPLKVTQ